MVLTSTNKQYTLVGGGGGGGGGIDLHSRLTISALAGTWLEKLGKTKTKDSNTKYMYQLQDRLPIQST